MSFPEPVIGLAIEPRTKADQEKLAQALGRLMDEDPTFRVRTDEETGQTVINGMGELHLEIIVDRLLREFSVDANVGQPQVAYRETIRKDVDKVEGRFGPPDRRPGPVRPRLHRHAARRPGRGLRVREQGRGRLGPPASSSRRSTMASARRSRGGIVAGYPMVDIRVQLVDGSYHDVDSSEVAFKIAGSIAAKEAARRGKPVLLEPVMAVEVVAPKDYVGGIVGDLTSRRGKIGGMEVRGKDLEVVNAVVPLAEMFGYATTVRSLTQGRATFTMQFDSYAQVPQNISEEIRERVGAA